MSNPSVISSFTSTVPERQSPCVFTIAGMKEKPAKYPHILQHHLLQIPAVTALDEKQLYFP
jgi:hypothetical protein